MGCYQECQKNSEGIFTILSSFTIFSSFIFSNNFFTYISIYLLYFLHLVYHRHTLSTHPPNASNLHILSIPTYNAPSQPTLSTHPFNPQKIPMIKLELVQPEYTAGNETVKAAHILTYLQQQGIDATHSYQHLGPTTPFYHTLLKQPLMTWT